MPRAGRQPPAARQLISRAGWVICRTVLTHRGARAVKRDQPSYTPDVVTHADAVIARVKADLEAGDWHLARHRLGGHIVDVPECEVARTELVLIYRAAGCPQEAGRWGFLVPGAATADELAAFESGCSARLTADWTASMMRRALHWPPGLTPSNPIAKTRLDELEGRAANEQLAWKLAIAPRRRRWINALARSLRGAT